MSSGEAELEGPDLSGWLPLEAVKEMQPLVGHVDGEAVVLVRRGSDVHAVGAKCTHYGGPLAEGLVVGDTLRCPWHHARFDLQSGAPVGAPALEPVGCWEVERAGDRVRVGRRRHVAPPRLGSEAGPSSVVIIGAGAAGNAAAEHLRRLGYQGPVALVGDEASVPYDRPNLSKDYLAGNAPEEWIPLRSPEWYAERQIELCLGTAASSIDLGARRVLLASGRTLDFGALLIATGAEPIALDVPGAGLPHVRYLRSLADSRAIIERAATAKRAAIIGSSFIGLEVAASLRARGLDVAVVGRETVPFGRSLGSLVGSFVRRLHEEHGVLFYMDDAVRAIDETSVVLASGAVLRAELVVVGIGVRPRTELAEAAGLTTAGGIVVDRRLETSVPGVFAAGDVARFPFGTPGELIRVEHWVHAERMGEHAARSMLGQPDAFADVPFFWTQHYDVPVCYVGHAESFDRADVAGSIEGRDGLVALRSSDRTLAVTSIFRDRESLAAEAALERGDEAILEHLVPRDLA